MIPQPSQAAPKVQGSGSGVVGRAVLVVVVRLVVVVTFGGPSQVTLEATLDEQKSREGSWEFNPKYM